MAEAPVPSAPPPTDPEIANAAPPSVAPALQLPSGDQVGDPIRPNRSYSSRGKIIKTKSGHEILRPGRTYASRGKMVITSTGYEVFCPGRSYASRLVEPEDYTRPKRSYASRKDSIPPPKRPRRTFRSRPETEWKKGVPVRPVRTHTSRVDEFGNPIRPPRLKDSSTLPTGAEVIPPEDRGVYPDNYCMHWAQTEDPPPKRPHRKKDLRYIDPWGTPIRPPRKRELNYYDEWGRPVRPPRRRELEAAENPTILVQQPTQMCNRLVRGVLTYQMNPRTLRYVCLAIFAYLIYYKYLYEI